MTPDAQADLIDCADEPIRVPGAVQPHGALLALDEHDLSVRVASANAVGVFGRPVGRGPLAELLEPDVAATVTAALRGDLAELDPLRVVVAGVEVDVVAHRADGLLLTEWEPLTGANEAGGAWHRRLPRVLSRLSGAGSLRRLTEVLAAEVRDLTGFDRVMVYRFDPEWNGEVVAEAREGSLEPLLGLRYPAADIPAQARALYVENWLRLIPDARYTPVPLLTLGEPLAGPLDLTGSLLRSVSPVHLEYLGNMGVVSSMSVSLVDRGRLWGLIACHHYAGAHRPSYADRVAAEFLGRSASLLLASKADSEDGERVLQVSDRLAELLGALARAPRRALEALSEGELTALDLLPADGVAIRLDGRLRLMGRTPSAADVERLAEQLPEGTTATAHLSSRLPAALDLVDTASGLLHVPVGPGGGGDLLAWFRGETLREVSWGGDPSSSTLVVAEDGVRLSPRRSFARWTEIVRATSAPWAPHEVAAAERLAGYLADVALRRSQEDGRLATALQRTLLLEHLPEIPGVALAAHYAPSASDVVGGDWYDLVPLPSGRLCVVLGDVAGHGLGAAAVTAQLRHGLRAMLLQDAGPARALQRLNELVGLLLPGEMATAVIAELDPASGTVALSSAGHLPVLHLSEGGTRLIGGGQGPALGLVDAATYAQLPVRLGAADRLLLYSDGLVERRTSDLDDRLEQLRSAARLEGGDAAALVDRLVAVMAPTGADDVTVLALGLH